MPDIDASIIDKLDHRHILRSAASVYLPVEQTESVDVTALSIVAVHRSSTSVGRKRRFLACDVLSDREHRSPATTGMKSGSRGPEAAMERKDHWENVYSTKAATQVGWYQPEPTASMDLIRAYCPVSGSVIDVGGGASFLVDRLLDAGYGRVGVIDISATALQQAKSRLRERAGAVEWIVADVTDIADVGKFDLWHDRAVFHFLTSPEDRKKYVELAVRTVRPGGHVVIGTFALDGPPRCSGLDVRRYDAGMLSDEFGPAFKLVGQDRAIHVTPSGKAQPFVFVVFSRE